MVTEEVLFDAAHEPIGFHGISGANFFQTIGAVTTGAECYKGKEIVTAEPAPGLSTEMLIVAIVVPVVVVLIIVGVVVGLIIAKKKAMDKEKTGSEIISVKKTRPQTPPVDTSKPLEKEKVHGLTDEEDAPQAGNEDAEDLKKTDKPDVHI